MQPFDAQERRDFIDEHIAHRLTALLSVISRQQADPNFFTGRSDVYRASIEGSYIMLRVFIEFLGVESARHHGKLALVQRTRDTKTRDQKRARDTDVMLDCFELPLATPNDFDPHQDLVARVHDGLSKSTAHFTYRTDHLFNAGEDFLPALGLVLRILQRRFFESSAGSTQDPCRLTSNTKSNHRL